MEQKQAIGYQLDMFVEHKGDAILYSESREKVNGATAGKDRQVKGQGKRGRALAGKLLRAVCSGDNIKQAYRQVKGNKGAAGIDGVLTGEFPGWYSAEGEHLVEEILTGKYEPQGVREVMIPKPDGGERRLGIPTVKDRVIQQAISQILGRVYEGKFSGQSYGFRPKRNAQQALKRASDYVSEGFNYVVDVDLKNFFDEVNHDRLMYRLSGDVPDKGLLQLIRRYLRSGILVDGVVSTRTAGTPQGSPLSPLLSNVVLDELDRELESRGHKFVRYADDCNIFVRSQAAGERVMGSICNFIEGKLKLKVNYAKSKAVPVQQSKFLGYTILDGGTLVLAEKSKTRFKAKIREIARRNRGKSFPAVISELNAVLRGWLNYFRLAKCQGFLQNMDGWIRRKLRCYRIKQCKRAITLQKFLQSLGVEKWHSWILALSGKGHWRKSSSPQAHQGMDLNWFRKQGLYGLMDNYNLLKV